MHFDKLAPGKYLTRHARLKDVSGRSIDLGLTVVTIALESDNNGEKYFCHEPFAAEIPATTFVDFDIELDSIHKKSC